MRRYHSFAIASLVAVLACNGDHATGPTTPTGVITDPPAVAQLTGIVVVDGATAETQIIHLLTSDGALVQLVGNGSRGLTSVPGGEVLVRGTWDGSPGLVVESFQVLAMNGRPAMDGVLEESDGQLRLRLINGPIFELTDAPTEISAYVGFRLWVTGSAQDPPISFGVIESQ